MDGDTLIAWSDRSWNPPLIFGCTPVTAGCEHCYAQSWHNRWNSAFDEALERNDRSKLPIQYGRRFTHIQYGHELFSEEQWWNRRLWPLHQLKPSLVFVNSMSD